MSCRCPVDVLSQMDPIHTSHLGPNLRIGINGLRTTSANGIQLATECAERNELQGMQGMQGTVSCPTVDCQTVKRPLLYNRQQPSIRPRGSPDFIRRDFLDARRIWPTMPCVNAHTSTPAITRSSLDPLPLHQSLSSTVRA